MNFDVPLTGDAGAAQEAKEERELVVEDKETTSLPAGLDLDFLDISGCYDLESLPGDLRAKHVICDGLRDGNSAIYDALLVLKERGQIETVVDSRDDSWT